MDGDEVELFEQSLRRATDAHNGRALDAALDELGWPEALAVDRRAAISTLFGVQGEANVTSSGLGQVVADALGLDGADAPGLVLPPMGRWDPPATLDGRGLHLRGLALSSLADVTTAVVVASSAGPLAAVTVPTSSLELRPVKGLDPSLGLIEVTADAVAPAAAPEPVPGDWDTAVARARLATAHELVGASRAMLGLAREHALGRVQFGRPIGSFQAIRHRLAETLVAIEMAEAVLDAAWLDGSSGTAAMAKAVAGSAARTTARHSQQVLAGIGFTTEHPLHHYIRRTPVLDGLFGGASTLTRALGHQLIEGRQLPALLPL